MSPNRSNIKCSAILIQKAYSTIECCVKSYNFTLKIANPTRKIIFSGRVYYKIQAISIPNETVSDFSAPLLPSHLKVEVPVHFPAP